MEERSLNEHLKDRKGQAMFSVVHGGLDPRLRLKSANFLKDLDFDGFGMVRWDDLYQIVRAF